MKRTFLLGMVFILSVSMANAATISWTDWTSATTGSLGTASGTIAYNGGSVDVTYTGELYFAQLNSSTVVGPGTTTNYWTQGTPAPYTGNAVISNAPTANELLALNSFSVVNTLTFSSPVLNPVFAVLSMGQVNQPVSYAFTPSYVVLSSGQGYWNIQTDNPSTYYDIAGTILIGSEFHGALQFMGSVSSISWTSSSENWHGFTVGAPVPLPAAAWMLGAGLIGLIAIRRRG